MTLLLFISDVSTRVSFIQFADVTSIYCTGSSLESVCTTLETEMISICEWLNNKQLFLNVSKTNYMYMIMTPSARRNNHTTKWSANRTCHRDKQIWSNVRS